MYVFGYLGTRLVFIGMNYGNGELSAELDARSQGYERVFCSGHFHPHAELRNRA